MPHVTFPEFLKDPGTYRSAQAYWVALWVELQSEAN
jgi:hypothetical protein